MKCPKCSAPVVESDAGSLACSSCGLVVEENAIVSEVTFSETASGASVLQGQFLSATSGAKPLVTGPGFSGVSRESREVTMRNGRIRIGTLAAALRLNSYIVDAAVRLFQAAMNHNFIQGRKTQNVVAACLYIICRREQTPHMLIDFSDILQTNVFVLGDTFSKFINVLHIKVPIVDPSLYIERFASRLEFGDKTRQVAVTALRLVGRMKRDWMQVGRRPSGLCGASLLIAARLHGFKRTHKEIVEVVRVCELTLRNRLSEFEQTPAGQLTPQEFATIDLEEEADPPSFTQARKRQKQAPAEKRPADLYQESIKSLVSDPMMTPMAEVLGGISMSAVEETEKQMEAELLRMEKNELNRIQNVIKSEKDKRPVTESPSQPPADDSLSDLDDDVEVVGALLTKDEVGVKTQLWLEANQEYLTLQEEKQKQLAESGALEKMEAKKRKRKTRAEVRSQPPANSAAEATMQALSQKKFSKKINYEVLENLFEDETKPSVGVPQPTSLVLPLAPTRGSRAQAPQTPQPLPASASTSSPSRRAALPVPVPVPVEEEA